MLSIPQLLFAYKTKYWYIIKGTGVYKGSSCRVANSRARATWQIRQCSYRIVHILGTL